jgi:ABC-2 type transport system ATP-binding protein
MSLEVFNLTKLYGTQKALDEVSFTVFPGRILGFLGPNGAGKSTAMKIITGFLSPNSGSVTVMGKDALNSPKEVSPLIGYLPEHNPLYLDMYVREFLEFSGGLYGLAGGILNSRTKEMLYRTGLEPEQQKKIGQLSKGFRQRLGLARAFLHDPEVVILDEPTTGLDPNQLVEVRNLIQEIAQDKTLILSTHIMQEVEAICQDVVIINKGKILAADSLAHLKSNSAETILILETEEEMQLDWFTTLGKVTYGKYENTQVLISCVDPTITRKAIMQIVSERSLNLIGLNQNRKNLETIFRDITNSEA